MEPQSSKLQHRQVEETAGQTTQQQHVAGAQTAREFGSVDEMLRHDSAQNPPPAELAERVAESVAGLPRPARSWWQRLLSGH